MLGLRKEGTRKHAKSRINHRPSTSLGGVFGCPKLLNRVECALEINKVPVTPATALIHPKCFEHNPSFVKPSSTPVTEPSAQSNLSTQGKIDGKALLTLSLDASQTRGSRTVHVALAGQTPSGYHSIASDSRKEKIHTAQ